MPALDQTGGDFDLRTRPSLPQPFEETSRPPLPHSHSHHRAVRPLAGWDCLGKSVKDLVVCRHDTTTPKIARSGAQRLSSI